MFSRDSHFHTWTFDCFDLPGLDIGYVAEYALEFGVIVIGPRRPHTACVEKIEAPDYTIVNEHRGIVFVGGREVSKLFAVFAYDCPSGIFFVLLVYPNFFVVTPAHTATHSRNLLSFIFLHKDCWGAACGALAGVFNLQMAVYLYKHKRDPRRPGWGSKGLMRDAL